MIALITVLMPTSFRCPSVALTATSRGQIKFHDPEIKRLLYRTAQFSVNMIVFDVLPLFQVPTMICLIGWTLNPPFSAIVIGFCYKTKHLPTYFVPAGASGT
jgi:hypothetical protein